MGRSLKAAEEIRQRELLLVRLGLDPTYQTYWYYKWGNLFSSVSANKLTFEEYIGLAIDAGIETPHQIGRLPGQYQLGRLGDMGDYEIGNCRFITKEENQKEKKNPPLTVEAKIKLSEAMRKSWAARQSKDG